MSAEILIIDDNSYIREILNDLIIEAGYSTRLAANYNQALSEIDKKFFHFFSPRISLQNSLKNSPKISPEGFKNSL